MVTVMTFATLRRFMEKESQVTIESGTTAGVLIDILSAMNPGLKNELFDETGVLRQYANILKNERNIHFLDGLKTMIEDNDLIAIFPPLRWRVTADQKQHSPPIALIDLFFGIPVVPEGEGHSQRHRRMGMACSDAQIYAHMSKIH